MSETYQDLDLTSFPDALDQQVILQDPQNASDLTAILAYEACIQNADYQGAAAVLNANPRLQSMQLTAQGINRHEQMILAIERMFKNDIDAYLRALADTATDKLISEVSTATQGVAANAERIKDCVYEIGRTTLTLGATGWTQNADGLYEQTMDIAQATTTGRIRWALQDSKLGVVLVAGVKCTANGKVTIVCMTRPSGAFEMTFVMEGVRE